MLKNCQDIKDDDEQIQCTYMHIYVNTHIYMDKVTINDIRCHEFERAIKCIQDCLEEENRRERCFNYINISKIKIKTKNF